MEIRITNNAWPDRRRELQNFLVDSTIWYDAEFRDANLVHRIIMAQAAPHSDSAFESTTRRTCDCMRQLKRRNMRDGTRAIEQFPSPALQPDPGGP